MFKPLFAEQFVSNPDIATAVLWWTSGQTLGNGNGTVTQYQPDSSRVTGDKFSWDGAGFVLDILRDCTIDILICPYVSGSYSGWFTSKAQINNVDANYIDINNDGKFALKGLSVTAGDELDFYSLGKHASWNVSVAANGGNADNVSMIIVTEVAA